MTPLAKNVALCYLCPQGCSANSSRRMADLKHFSSRVAMMELESFGFSLVATGATYLPLFPSSKFGCADSTPLFRFRGSWTHRLLVCKRRANVVLLLWRMASVYI